MSETIDYLTGLNDQIDSYVDVFADDSVETYTFQKGVWILGNVNQTTGWPTVKTIVVFRGIKIVLLPSTEEFYPAAAILSTSYNEIKTTKTTLMHFFSSLAWSRSGKIEIVAWTNSSLMSPLNDHLRLKNRGLIQIQTPNFRPTYLPDPQDKTARLALGFYREGLSLDHEAYSFLSFYKIINLYGDGEQRKRWVQKNLTCLEKASPVFKKELERRLAEIQSEHGDPSKYLFESCRCAVAHASVDDITYDPENIDDEIRLGSDKPLIMHLARVMIEEEFKVKTPNTIFKEHLYQLQGFHKLLKSELVIKLKNKETISRRAIKIDELLSLRFWNYQQLAAFEGLRPRIIQAHDGVIKLQLHDKKNILYVNISLDFPNEILIFDPMSDIICVDDNSSCAANYAADIMLFQGKCAANGSVEIWTTSTEIFLGRTEPYIPFNAYYVGDEVILEKVAVLKDLAKKRAQSVS